MTISALKTKFMTTSKTPLRCKFKIDKKIIQQVMKFKYLGISISGFGKAGVREQKATRVAGCLNDTIWQNRNIGTETKSRIYKAVIRPIMTYTAETRPDTSKTKQFLDTTAICYTYY